MPLPHPQTFATRRSLAFWSSSPLRQRATSIAGLDGGMVGAHYAANKVGLHGLIHHLAPRVAAHGMTVNSLAPALIGETRMLPLGPDFGGTPVPIPVGRVGRPDDVAELAVAMLGNGYLTNKVVTLDGGLLPR